MKNRIKGCTHHDSKVVQKLAAGGMAGSRNMNSDKSGVAGPRSSGGASRGASSSRSAGGSNKGSGVNGFSGGFRQGTNNNDVGPRGGPAPRTGLTTGKTWSGNTAFGKSGGPAMGFARNAAEAKAKMAAAARPSVGAKSSLQVPRKVTPQQTGVRKVAGVTANIVRKPQPKIPFDRTLANFKPWWTDTVTLGRKNPFMGTGKKYGPLGDGWDERLPQDTTKKSTSSEE